MSTFKDKTCILHHFSFLVWLLARNFSSPNPSILPPKNPLFNDHFALFCHVFHGSRRFFLCHDTEFLCTSSCILRHFALHFAAFYLAFCTKTHCILHQNALHLAPKRTAFSGILHYILPQIAQKTVKIAVL